ncbi:metalloregulator ArsR/SmtB family transcription factor [Poseidonibacter lekithochrous]|uniref:ArsR/SmtB family transcription factor n=1 Tax=Poseidonibacter TaxID=2321187 RepID=UPI001C086315|nr:MULTISPECIES: metalloregulator ArsR/SmtB family transcription factor [Poseidonibacter]MBU3015920.1 metalloregulator ArsR/SmtB family transcription factor [Poseidonibacter lekithochrous]MDO6829219.1 metalloregulator ArsR/SmtB family transcription factor [Poseidonibacter sp. 1_MG-2023]
MGNKDICLKVDINKDIIAYEKEQLILENNKFFEKEKLFSLLGSEVRLKIIYLLLKYEKLCVCDISEILQMNQSPISQHLRKLKDAEILISKREGILINYYVNSSYKAKLSSLM